MFKKLKRSKLALTLSCLLLTCGKLNPNAGTNDKLTLGKAGANRDQKSFNPNDSAIGFSLQEGPADLSGRTFSGAMLLWHPNITGEGFEQLFKRTKAYNAEVARSQLEFMDFESKTLIPGLRRYQTLKQEQASQKASQRTQIDSEQSNRASTWLTSQRDEFAPELGSLEASSAFAKHYDEFMDTYCEAQILRFSLSAVAAKGVFWKRPSPMALCETRYLAQGFLQSNSCIDNQSTGKNYWDCLWQEGVVKTRFWKLLPLKTQQILSTSLATEQGRVLFGASVLENTDPCSPLVVRNTLMKMEGSLNCPVLSDSSLSLVMTTLDSNNLEVAVGADKRNKTTQTVTADRAIFSLGSFVANAGRTIPQTSFPDALRPIPDTLSLASGTTLSLQTPQRVSLASRLKLMTNWISESGCAEDLKSPNDIIFNGVKLAVADSLRSCPAVGGVSQSLPNIEWKAETLAGLEDPTKVLKLTSEARANFCLSKSAGGCSDPLVSEVNTTCRLEKRSEQKLLAARQKNVSQGFFREVKFSFADSSVTVSFSNGRFFEVPVDFSFKSIGVWKGKDGVMQSRISASTGALEIKLSLVSDFFASENFSAEDAADIKGFDKYLGKNLDIELFSNALEGVRPYLSGKIFVTDTKGTTLAQGVASYLLDSSFDEKVSKICGANLETLNPENMTAAP